MKLPIPQQLKTELPLHETLDNEIQSYRETIRNIIMGKDDRIAIVVGPCSIHHVDATLEYAYRLKKISDKLSDSLYIVMRAYLEKPRSTTGWKGFLYDPYLDESHNIGAGLRLSRHLLIELTTLRLPLATEFLDPLTSRYFSDLISWGFIGARTCTSSIHRQLASSLKIPFGFKNTVDGNIDHAIHGIQSARSLHSFLAIDDKGEPFCENTQGNFSTHLVLRGSNLGPNYDKESVCKALDKLTKEKIASKILIDCSHGNSNKRPEKQKEVFLDVMRQVEQGNKKIMGVMLESFIDAGNQSLSENSSSIKSSLSITDPCLDIDSTEELLYSASEILSSSSKSPSSKKSW
jgi:3-deoxy-7-phosphoheptulonate synthase